MIPLFLRTTFPKRKLESFFQQIVSAMADVHSQGYGHRDLKPVSLSCVQSFLNNNEGVFIFPLAERVSYPSVVV